MPVKCSRQKIFSNLKNLKNFNLINVTFDDSIPSDIFENSKIDIFRFTNVSLFEAFSPIRNQNYNIDVRLLILNHLRSPFNSLYQNIFQKITEIRLLNSSSIELFDNDFKINFQNLLLITYTSNQKKVIKSVTNSTSLFFLNERNFNYLSSNTDKIIILAQYGPPSTYYIDENFCLFTKFPYINLLIDQIDNKNFISHKTVCPCTIYWLFKQSYDNNNSKLPSCANRTTFDDKYRECNFPDKLFKCSQLYTTKTRRTSSTTTNYIQLNRTKRPEIRNEDITPDPDFNEEIPIVYQLTTSEITNTRSKSTKNNPSTLLKLSITTLIYITKKLT